MKAAQVDLERRAQEARTKAQEGEQRKARLQKEAADQANAGQPSKETVMKAPAKAQQPARGPMDAVATSARVKKVLETNPQYKGVTVVMSNGVARLSGLVKTADEKKQAGDLAKKVQGVRDVLNNITVRE